MKRIQSSSQGNKNGGRLGWLYIYDKKNEDLQYIKII